MQTVERHSIRRNSAASHHAELIDLNTGRTFEVCGLIRVSANSRRPEGYVDLIDISGTLPRCRKRRVLNATTFASGVVLRPLWAHNGEARVDAFQWQRFLESLPVVSCDISPYEVDEELAHRVRFEHSQRTGEAVAREARDAAEWRARFAKPRTHQPSMGVEQAEQA